MRQAARKSATEPCALFEPLLAGELELPNRIVMAPLTRQRAGSANIPTDLSAEYYVQRASAGLIITEATQISSLGQGFADTPGIWSPAQIEGWRNVTRRVHAAGGRIVLQLWHAGRAAHPLVLGGLQPVGPSEIAIKGNARTPEGYLPHVIPRALSISDIEEIVEQFGNGARNALNAGFDGVEIHGANGYLIDQFLTDGANRREDAYGGPVENRLRFMIEILRAVTSVWPAGRVGIRFSPLAGINDCVDSDSEETYRAAIRAANQFGLAYLHIIEPRVRGNVDATGPTVSAAALYRDDWEGALIAAGGLSRESGSLMIAEGVADAVAYGRLYIANPDLVERFRIHAPLNPYDRATFYGGGKHGYTDYPTLEPAERQDDGTDH